jgi:hypothetical protein
MSTRLGGIAAAVDVALEARVVCGAFDGSTRYYETAATFHATTEQTEVVEAVSYHFVQRAKALGADAADRTVHVYEVDLGDRSIYYMQVPTAETEQAAVARLTGIDLVWVVDPVKGSLRPGW